MTDQAKVLPRYRCHKVVAALKIKEIKSSHQAYGKEDGPVDGAWITPAEEGYPSIWVPLHYVQKHNPQVGGYYVIYDDRKDATIKNTAAAYASWSPAKEFEDGYTLIAESEAPAPGEAVYGWEPGTGLRCGGCGFFMLTDNNVDVGKPWRPIYTCSNETCSRHGKRYELSTAHAVILREVAQPAAPEAKE